MLSRVVVAFDSIFLYFKITFIVIYIFLVGLLARVTVIARLVSRVRVAFMFITRVSTVQLTISSPTHQHHCFQNKQFHHLTRHLT